MRIVIQRVTRASVSIEGRVESAIEKGMMVLLGVGYADTDDDIDWLVKKTINLRIFDDSEGVMNLSVKDVEGNILVNSHSWPRARRAIAPPTSTRQAQMCLFPFTNGSANAFQSRLASLLPQAFSVQTCRLNW